MELSEGLITLRPWREEDAPVVFSACQDPEILHWIPVIPRPYTQKDAEAFVTGATGFGPYQFAIIEQECVVGCIGLRLNDSGTGHIGYWCLAAARGRGIATKALRMLCRYALDELQLHRLELITDPDNAASQRVAKNVGFRREGVLRSHLVHPDGRRRDSVMFSLLPGELT